MKHTIIRQDGTERELDDHDIQRLRFAVNARSREIVIDPEELRRRQGES